MLTDSEKEMYFRVVFCPMLEVSGAVKQFTISINQRFRGGTLFLLLTDQEFKKFLMEMSSEMLEENSAGCRKHAPQTIGRNQLEGGKPFWVLSETVQISGSSTLIENSDESLFLWLQRLINGSNILLQEPLKCVVSIPLDNGQGITDLCLTIRAFMPEIFTAAMATMSAVAMGSNYTCILRCCGVPILTRPPGSCKSEATKCALSPFGAYESHTCNNQTTPSYLFKAASKITIPIYVDDISEKSADAWEKLFIIAYNGSGRGTRLHGIETFQMLPIVSANWCIGNDRQRAHTRSIHIAFQHHEDEPGANLLFANMTHKQIAASKSVGELIKLSKRFEQDDTKDIIHRDICPSVIHILSQFNALVHFTTTSIFMFFLRLVCYMSIALASLDNVYVEG